MEMKKKTWFFMKCFVIKCCTCNFYLVLIDGHLFFLTMKLGRDLK